MAGRNLYVDASLGTDAGPGTDPKNPWKTLSFAIGKIISDNGDIIYATGTFAEKITVGALQKGTAKDRTVLDSWNQVDSAKTNPVIDATGESSGVTLDATEYVTISNFTVENAMDADISIKSSNVIISKNVLSNTARGVVGDGASNSLVANNLILNNSVCGVALWKNSTNIKLINNTLYENDAGFVIGDNKEGAAPNTTLKNNIIYIGDGSGIDVDANSSLTFDSDYNDLYISGAGKTGTWEGVSTDTLVDWQTASSQDANSISGDPEFVSLVKDLENYHLQENSPCVDAGEDVSGDGVIDDKAGLSRPQGDHYDIGCYEREYIAPPVPDGTSRPTSTYTHPVIPKPYTVNYGR